MLQHVTTLCACHGRLPSIGLFGDAKQAMGEGKSGPVETGLTGPVATALHSQTFKPTQASFAHTNSQPSHSVLEDFFKVPPSHMKVPPDHYKGPQATSKGFATLLIPVAAMESSIAPLWSPDSLIIHEQNRPDSAIQGCPTF